jgi:hypothetical protein
VRGFWKFEAVRCTIESVKLREFGIESNMREIYIVHHDSSLQEIVLHFTTVDYSQAGVVEWLVTNLYLDHSLTLACETTNQRVLRVVVWVVYCLDGYCLFGLISAKTWVFHLLFSIYDTGPTDHNSQIEKNAGRSYQYRIRNSSGIRSCLNSKVPYHTQFIYFHAKFDTDNLLLTIYDSLCWFSLLMIQISVAD